MKKTSIVVTLVCLIVFGAIAGLTGINKLKAIVSSLAYISTSSATTSPNFMTAGTATTTFNLYDTTQFFDDSGFDQNQLFIAFKASTSAATLQWQYEFSNNAVDWYEEDIPVQYGVGQGISTMDHASTTITHRWLPGSTVASTSYKTLTIPNNAARYKRVVFSIPVGSTAGAVWAQAANKQYPQ